MAHDEQTSGPRALVNGCMLGLLMWAVFGGLAWACWVMTSN